MNLQEEKFKQTLEAKDDQIVRQQELLIAQKKQLQEREKMKQDPNVIQITELQKLASMETTDKYAVLEFLVKELMGMRKDDLLKQGDLFRTANVQYQFEDQGFSPTSNHFRRARAQTFDEKPVPGHMKAVAANQSARDDLIGGKHPLTSQVNEMLAGAPKSDRPENLRPSTVSGNQVIEESMGEFDETLGQSQARVHGQALVMSASMKKGGRGGKGATRNAAGPTSSSKLRHSTDKGSKKHVTINEENDAHSSNRSPSQSQSYYGDEFESLSKSHVSASRRTSKDLRGKKGRSNASASQSYSQNFEDSRVSEDPHGSGKKVSNFSGKRKSAEAMNENYSPIKEQRDEASLESQENAPGGDDEYTSVENSESTHRAAKYQNREAAASEQKPRKPPAIDESRVSSSYMSSADKKSNLAAQLKGSKGAEGAKAQHISVSGLSLSGTAGARASSNMDDTEEDESESVSISQSDAKTKEMWALLRQKYLGGGKQGDDDGESEEDDEDGVSDSMAV